MKFPSRKIELEIINGGIEDVVGVDEAGRGALAGPVVSAAYMPGDQVIGGVRDSKKLSPKKRKKLFGQIIESAKDWSVGFANQEEIDGLGIVGATDRSMVRAVGGIFTYGMVLVDGIRVPDNLEGNGLSIVRGDANEYCISCASILAKVIRDEYMSAMSKFWPVYGFERHKGYGTVFHRQAIGKFGHTKIHRKTFRLR